MAARFGIFIRVKRTTHCRFYSQNIEVVAGHHEAEDLLRLLAVSGNAQSDTLHVGHFREHRVLAAVVVEIETRQGKLGAEDARTIAFVGRKHTYQRSGIVHRNRTEENRVYEREDVVFAPMPNASDNAATIVNEGVFASRRIPYWMSLKKVFMTNLCENRGQTPQRRRETMIQILCASAVSGPDFPPD